MAEPNAEEYIGKLWGLWANAADLYHDMTKLKREYKIIGKNFLGSPEMKKVGDIGDCIFDFLQFQLPMGGKNAISSAPDLYSKAKKEYDKVVQMIGLVMQESATGKDLEVVLQ